MKKYRVELTTDELEAIIRYHMQGEIGIETSKRIHDLTKKLKNDGPEISNDPRPVEVHEQKDIW